MFMKVPFIRRWDCSLNWQQSLDDWWGSITWWVKILLTRRRDRQTHLRECLLACYREAFLQRTVPLNFFCPQKGWTFTLPYLKPTFLQNFHYRNETLRQSFWEQDTLGQGQIVNIQNIQNLHFNWKFRAKVTNWIHWKRVCPFWDSKSVTSLR